MSAASASDERRLRVLIASSIYPPHIGGPAIQAELFARKLARRGVEVRVLTFGPSAENGDVRVECLNPAGGRGALATLLRQASIARRVARLFADFRPDAVQMQTAGGLFPLTVGICARFHGIPSWVKYPSDPVRSMHHAASARARGQSAAWKLRLRTATVKLLSKMIFGTYRFVWATTPTVAERLTSQWGVPPERIVVAPNLIELNRLDGERPTHQPASGRQLRLLVVARLDGIKGVDVAIRALAELDRPGAVLRVLGEGPEPYVDHLHDLADQLGVSDRIEWAGKLPRGRLDEEYRKADLLLVPSRYEAFGVVIVEAMAVGLPVVASNVGGIPHVVQDGKCARLVEPDDPAALARAIRDIAGKPDEISRLRQEGLKRARDFDAEAGIDKWLAVYRASAIRSARPLAERGML